MTKTSESAQVLAIFDEERFCDLGLEEACARLKSAVRDAIHFEHLPGGEVARETVVAAAETLLRCRWADRPGKAPGYSGLEDLEYQATRAVEAGLDELDDDELALELACVGNAVYNAARIVEVLEGVGKFIGHGHHARQRLAAIAKGALRELRRNSERRGT